MAHLLYLCMVKSSKNSDWSACSLHTLPTLWLVSLWQHTPSLLSDWSVCAHTHPPYSKIGQSVLTNTLPGLRMRQYICVKEPITIVKFNGKSKLTPTDRHTHSLTTYSSVLGLPFIFFGGGRAITMTLAWLDWLKDGQSTKSYAPFRDEKLTKRLSRLLKGQ